VLGDHAGAEAAAAAALQHLETSDKVNDAASRDVFRELVTAMKQDRDRRAS